MCKFRMLIIALVSLFIGLLIAGCSSRTWECEFNTDCEGSKICRNRVCVDPGDPCEGVECNTPPDQACIDSETLRTYASSGHCVEGSCVYDQADITCSQGCENGYCIGEPCAGVVCDQPPNDQCYQPTGNCVASPAVHCEYDAIQNGTDCQDGNACTTGDTCQDGICQSGDPVTCTTPPDNYCLNSAYLVSYSPNGTCVSGECSYSSSQVACDYGCANGQCQGCTADCAGKCGGPDGCQSTCPDTCLNGLICRPPGYHFCAPPGSVEFMGRGLMALPKNGAVYLGWRLLPWDAADIGFNVYRATSAGGTFTAKVNTAPISGSTNYDDTSAQSGTTYYYLVRTVTAGGAEGSDSNLTRVTAGSTSNHIDIPMTANDACPAGLDWRFGSWGGVAPGDVNGDGVLDFAVLMFEYKNIARPYCIELFESGNGGWTSKWRVSTGHSTLKNSGVVLWDLDGDGRAEIFTRTGANGDLSALNRETGAIENSTAWPYSINLSGNGNIVSAYLEDLNGDSLPEPFILTQNGMYLIPAENPRFAAFTYNPQDGFSKHRDVTFSLDGVDGDHPWTRAMGTHGFYVADLNGDGLDEVMPCGSVLYPDWDGYWVIAANHSDVCHAGDVVESTPGVELLVGSDDGESFLVNFNSGAPQELWHIPAVHASGWDKGWCADLIAGRAGMECTLMDHDETAETTVECVTVQDCPFPDLQECKDYDLNDPDNPLYCTPVMVTRLFTSGGLEITGEINFVLQYYNPMDWVSGDGLKSTYMTNCGPTNPTGCMNGELADVIGDSREEVLKPYFEGGMLQIFSNPQLRGTRQVTPLADRGYRTVVARLGCYSYNKVAVKTNQARFDMIPEATEGVGPCEGRPDGFVCRPVRGDCDLAETCNGNSPDCPTDSFVPQGTTCRQSSEGCDPAEVCPGNSPDCPADVNNCLDTLYLYLNNGPSDTYHAIDLDPGEVSECYEFNTTETSCSHGARACNCCERSGNQYRVYFVPWETYVPTAIGPWVSSGLSEAEVGDGCLNDPPTFPCYYVVCGSR